MGFKEKIKGIQKAIMERTEGPQIFVFDKDDASPDTSGCPPGYEKIQTLDGEKLIPIQERAPCARCGRNTTWTEDHRACDECGLLR